MVETVLILMLLVLICGAEKSHVFEDRNETVESGIL